MKAIKTNLEINLHMLEVVANMLGELRDQVVFAGGCATALLITDPAIPDVRQTIDVDCIVDVVTQADYHKIENQLRQLGFYQSLKDEVICRWRIKREPFYLDIMPTEERILGFSNNWYKLAIMHAKEVKLKNKLKIKLISPPYFLATKIEAFKGRGNNDFLASHDLEDIIAVIEGRLELIDEVKDSDEQVKQFIAKEFGILMKNIRFVESLPGHLSTSLPENIKLITQKINEIIKIK